MTQPTMYAKLTRLSLSSNETLASPTEPPLPFITTTVGPSVGSNAMGPIGAGTPTLTEPLANCSTVPPPPTYDYYGAMLFTVATVCVYGLAIVFFIAGHTRKRLMNKDEERQISSYLKRVHLEETVKDDQKFNVIRLKSELLAASALGQRHDRRVSLMHRQPRRSFRVRMDRPEFGREKISFPELEEDDEEEEADSSPERGLLSRDSRVRRINENFGISAAPSLPFRGHRMGLMGLGDVDSARDTSGSEEESDSETDGGLMARHPHFFTACGLASIEEDDVSLQSLDAGSAAQCQDSPDIQAHSPQEPQENSQTEETSFPKDFSGILSQNPEDPHAPPSPEQASCPDSPPGEHPAGRPHSGSSDERSEDVWHPQQSGDQQMQNGSSCESVTDTWL